MHAMRCIECGDFRWSLIGFGEASGRCELCGGQMVVERRRPDGLRRGGVERRELTHLVAHLPPRTTHRPTV